MVAPWKGVIGAVAFFDYAAENTDSLATAQFVLERKENMMSGVVTRRSWCDRGLKTQFSLNSERSKPCLAVVFFNARSWLRYQLLIFIAICLLPLCKVQLLTPVESTVSFSGYVTVQVGYSCM